MHACVNAKHFYRFVIFEEENGKSFSVSILYLKVDLLLCTKTSELASWLWQTYGLTLSIHDYTIQQSVCCLWLSPTLSFVWVCKLTERCNLFLPDLQGDWEKAGDEMWRAKRSSSELHLFRPSLTASSWKSNSSPRLINRKWDRKPNKTNHQTNNSIASVSSDGQEILHIDPIHMATLDPSLKQICWDLLVCLNWSRGNTRDDSYSHSHMENFRIATSSCECECICPTKTFPVL